MHSIVAQELRQDYLDYHDSDYEDHGKGGKTRGDDMRIRGMIRLRSGIQWLRSRFSPLKAVERILVARPGRIGDVLVTTPMVRTLKRAYPGAHLTYISGTHEKDVLLNNPDIDELMLNDADILRRVAMQPSYDLVINFGLGDLHLPSLLPSLRDLEANQAIGILAGAKYRVGFSCFQNIRIGHLKAYNVYVDLRGRDAINLNLSITRALGLKDAGRETTLVLTLEEQDFANSFWEGCGLTQGRRVVGLHPGGRKSARLWAVNDYARVADELMAHSGCRILVFQGPGEEETAKSVCQAMQNQALLVPLLEIRKYAALVKKCHLLISSDGGPVHIAAAVGVNLLGIYRKEVSSDYWFPYRNRPGCLLLVESLSRRITVQEVLTAARQLLCS
jgi:ADP-heptose:LPS heptosyltransferase